MYITQWLAVRQRSIVVAPDVSSGLAAYRFRVGEILLNGGPGALAHPRPPALLFPGSLRESLEEAVSLAGQHPAIPVVIPASTDTVLATLLDPDTPTKLVTAALQGLVPVEPAEKKILDTVVNARQLAPLLRSPYEGLVYYMLEARKETRGRFQTNRRVDKPMGRGSYEVDLIAADTKLIVEVDGVQHRTPIQIIRDERKQRELQQLGYRIRRFSAEQVAQNPVGVWRLIYEQLQSHETLG
jgi:very-short-patch-repair endonuclease